MGTRQMFRADSFQFIPSDERKGYATSFPWGQIKDHGYCESADFIKRNNPETKGGGKGSEFNVERVNVARLIRPLFPIFRLPVLACLLRFLLVDEERKDRVRTVVCLPWKTVNRGTSADQF